MPGSPEYFFSKAQEINYSFFLDTVKNIDINVISVNADAINARKSNSAKNIN